MIQPENRDGGRTVNTRRAGIRLSSFQIIIAGFLAVILAGALLLTLPASARDGRWTPASDALFTSASAVCVTGLAVRDTGSYWSLFGQAVILALIQIGGLGIVSVTAMIASASGKRISLLQRSMLQESFSAHQLGGVMNLTVFVVKTALIADDAAPHELTERIKKAKQRGDIDAFLFTSATEEYLVAMVDSL